MKPDYGVHVRELAVEANIMSTHVPTVTDTIVGYATMSGRLSRMMYLHESLQLRTFESVDNLTDDGVLIDLGSSSYVYPATGSPYINTLVDVLSSNCGTRHFTEMHQMVSILSKL